MTQRTDASKASQLPAQPACPVCERPLPANFDGACPGCGHSLAPADVTAEDHTPYALAMENGTRHAWRTMCGWVFGAGKSRLAHVGLSRPSRASRRFATINVFWLAFVVLLAVFANTGWHAVLAGPGVLATPPQPEGKGWWLAVERPGPRHELLTTAGVRITDLWWNFPRAVITAVGAFVLSFAVGLILVRLLGSRSSRAFGPEHHGTQRLRCALHYSTAWMLFLMVSGLILMFRPVALIAEVAEWSVRPSSVVFDIPAVLAVLVGVLLWWFWLIRLGDTVPRESRRRVGRFFLLSTPLWVLAFAGATVAAVVFGGRYLAAALNLTW